MARIILSTILVLLALFNGALSASSDAPRWCCKSQREFRKCTLLAKNPAFNFRCYIAAETKDCMTKLLNNEVDVIVLDGGDMYDYRDQGIRVLASEDSGNGLASYYAVVVVKKGDPVTQEMTLSNIDGYKSCHTGVGKTAGWKMPMGHFVTTGILPKQSFSASCAPGANRAKYQALIDNIDSSQDYDNWCQLCIGDIHGDRRCDRSNDERFYGYEGAFRCLQGPGDVAFIKHSIITADVADSYELLCPDGSRAHPSDWSSCNLGKVPAHAVVTRQNMNEQTAQQIVETLNSAKKVIGSSFTTLIGKDLLWSSKTVSFLPNDLPVHQYLGKEYECNMAAYQSGFPDADCIQHHD